MSRKVNAGREAQKPSNGGKLQSRINSMNSFPLLKSNQSLNPSVEILGSPNDHHFLLTPGNDKAGDLRKSLDDFVKGKLQSSPNAKNASQLQKSLEEFVNKDKMKFKDEEAVSAVEKPIKKAVIPKRKNPKLKSKKEGENPDNQIKKLNQIPRKQSPKQPLRSLGSSRKPYMNGTTIKAMEIINIGVMPDYPSDIKEYNSSGNIAKESNNFSNDEMKPRKSIDKTSGQIKTPTSSERKSRNIDTVSPTLLNNRTKNNRSNGVSPQSPVGKNRLVGRRASTIAKFIERKTNSDATIEKPDSPIDSLAPAVDSYGPRRRKRPSQNVLTAIRIVQDMVDDSDGMPQKSDLHGIPELINIHGTPKSNGFSQTDEIFGMNNDFKNFKKFHAAKESFVPPKCGVYMGHIVHPHIMNPPYILPPLGRILFGPFEKRLADVETELNITHLFQRLDYYYAPSKNIKLNQYKENYGACI